MHLVFTSCTLLFLQIVNLIEETGHFHITNTTFDFDLCSLDRSTVRKLQSYLETSGLSWGSEQLAAGSLSPHTNFSWTPTFDAMQNPHCGWVHLLCVQPAGWTGPLWIKRWPHTTDTRARCRGYEPCRSGDHPGSLEHIIWFIGKKWGVATLLLLNECAYCYHVCFLICCSLWQMHGQHCLTTL